MNVDLEIVSRSKLDAIANAISGTAHELHCGPLRKGVFLLSLECNFYPKDADSAILTFCTALRGLGKPERRLWDRALRRTFDVGYGLARGQAAVQVGLQSKTLKSVIALGATVAFTCYRDDDSEPPDHLASKRD